MVSDDIHFGAIRQIGPGVFGVDMPGLFVARPVDDGASVHTDIAIVELEPIVRDLEFAWIGAVDGDLGDPTIVVSLEITVVVQFSKIDGDGGALDGGCGSVLLGIPEGSELFSCGL